MFASSSAAAVPWTFIPEIDAAPPPSPTTVLAYRRYASVADSTYHLRYSRVEENALVSQYRFTHPPNPNWPALSITVHQPANTTPLLSIPVEIRLRIFSFLLVSDSTVDYQDHTKVLWLTKQNSKNEVERFRVLHGDLLRPLQVNRQIYFEIMPFFYKENTFKFASHQSLKQFLTGIGHRRRKCIRSIVVSDGPWTVSRRLSQVAGEAYKLLSESCCLQKLHIKLEETDHSRRMSQDDTYILADLSKKLPGASRLKLLRGLMDVFIHSTWFDYSEMNRGVNPNPNSYRKESNKQFLDELVRLMKSLKTLIGLEDALDVKLRREQSRLLRI